jgi:hypothetical protein
MTEQAYRFNASAIDKLNKDPDTQCLRSWRLLYEKPRPLSATWGDFFFTRRVCCLSDSRTSRIALREQTCPAKRGHLSPALAICRIRDGAFSATGMQRSSFIYQVYNTATDSGSDIYAVVRHTFFGSVETALGG